MADQLYRKTENAGVRLLGKSGWRHTWNDWGLYWTDVFISEPESETYSVNIPGRHGRLDLSEALTGEPVYKNRLISASFVFPSKGALWHKRYSEILNELHGRVVQLIFDSDPGYYYEGRCAVSSARENGFYSSFSVTVDAFPFKYELLDSLGDWLWDPLDFNNGIIREYGNIIVPAQTEAFYIRVIGSEMTTSVDITVTTPGISNYLLVFVDGKWIRLQTGTYRSAFVLRESKTIVFYNTNSVPVTVQLYFRTGRL